MTGEWLLDTTVWSVRLLLAVAMVLCFIRLVLGPSLPDRVIALDMLATVFVGIIAVDAIATGDASFLRVGIVVALLGFFSTTAFALYMQRGYRT